MDSDDRGVKEELGRIEGGETKSYMIKKSIFSKRGKNKKAWYKCRHMGMWVCFPSLIKMVTSLK